MEITLARRSCFSIQNHVGPTIVHRRDRRVFINLRWSTRFVSLCIIWYHFNATLHQLHRQLNIYYFVELTMRLAIGYQIIIQINCYSLLCKYFKLFSAWNEMNRYAHVSLFTLHQSLRMDDRDFVRIVLRRCRLSRIDI